MVDALQILIKESSGSYPHQGIKLVGMTSLMHYVVIGLWIKESMDVAWKQLQYLGRLHINKQY